MKPTKTINHQKKQIKREFMENGKLALAILNLRHDDSYGNGHNTFSITMDIYKQYYNPFEPKEILSTGKKVWLSCCGCMHDKVKKIFPEYTYLIKWHLTSTDGPMHYIANTLYFASNKDFKGDPKEPDLDAARRCAVWSDAELKDFTRENLENRLPDLLENFRKDIEGIGFTY